MTPEPEPLTKAHLQMLKELEEKHNPYGVSELSDWHYALEDAWPKILATIKARGERIAELEDIVADWSQSAERVQEDRCHEDERHCGCVVFLRKRIADLERCIECEENIKMRYAAEAEVERLGRKYEARLSEAYQKGDKAWRESFEYKRVSEYRKRAADDEATIRRQAALLERAREVLEEFLDEDTDSDEACVAARALLKDMEEKP